MDAEEDKNIIIVNGNEYDFDGIRVLIDREIENKNDSNKNLLNSEIDDLYIEFRVIINFNYFFSY
jgi:hypothetical protein